MKTIMRRASVLVLAFALVGCASTGNPRDPMEGFNRAMFTFNDAIDQNALKPVAETYQRMLPGFVQTGVGNFFANLGDVWTAVNNLLQGNGAKGSSDIMRVAINSSFGLGGLIDIASDAGLPKHREDFGQTLGKWGVISGPYMVLPLLGSSTVRDTIVLPLEWKADPWRYVDPMNVRNAGSFLRLVDQRAAVLGATNLIEEAALDRYEFVRDAYLQRRQNSVDDGNSRKRSSFDDNGVLQTADSEEGAAEVKEKEPFYKGLVKFLRPAETMSDADKSLAK